MVKVKKKPLDKLLEEAPKEICPVEWYTYYGFDVLLQLLLSKKILEHRDMRLLIKRINEKVRKAGYR